MGPYLCAVDVGTRSARAGIFDPDGVMLARAVAEFPVFDGPGRQAEYESGLIWQAVGTATRAALAGAGVAPAAVAALGFDATCSLVLRDRDGAPLRLGGAGRDTIAWYDHRAEAEARDCTATGHRLIDHLGGAMSPEMQTPKLMWLKRQRPDLWARLGSARDLADHLTQRATGSDAASACSLAAKWAYLPGAGGWQGGFLAAVGLADLPLPGPVTPVGQPVGYLTPGAAADLGLAPGIPVAAGMIDAYAGALGTIGLQQGGARPWLTLIAGTSTCLMAVSPQPVFARGIWGPTPDTVLPGRWTSEGGQSAAGAALEWVLDLWPTTGAARPDHAAVLARIAELLARPGPELGAGLDVLPDFNGNRAPLMDAQARGVISGLGLERSFDGLCALYWRTAVGLALGVRQILAHLGPPGEALAIAGGLARTPLLNQLFADAAGLPILRAEGDDAMLLGSAIAAATAGGLQADLASAARAMTRLAQTLAPDPARRAAYDRDYAVMLRMQRHRAELAALRGAPASDGAG